ncbi:MAG: hypothetical protein ABI846_14655 [Rudaea sp.]
MNNEFQWRSGMRKLNEEVAPGENLWPAISARLEPRRAQRSPWQRRLAAIAATLVVASAAGLVAYRHAPKPGASPVMTSATQATRTPGSSGEQGRVARTALDWAVPADPKLASAALDLDKASADLQSALEAHPDAVFLVSMINRTNSQRMRLMRQSAISG